jgi:two-component system response regulator RegX3
MNVSAILVVDDDTAHLDRVVPHLSLLKMAVLKAQTKDEAIHAFERHSIELVLLELGLGSEIDPDVVAIRDSANLPALEILEIIRFRQQYTPVIVVTYFEKPLYELMAIRSGADAYLRKPVDLNLLSAYVRSKLGFGALVVSHSESAANGNSGEGNGRSILMAGELLIDTKQRLIRVGNAPYRGLSTKEVKLLTLLARNPGTVLGRRELFESVWGATAGESYDAVDAAIKRLRRKIEPSLRRPRYLIAIRGLGYCLAE